MELEQQLRAALLACEPGPQPLAQVMARLSAGRRAPRGGSRTILIGTLLAVAAAASMLVMGLRHNPVARVAAATSMDAPAPVSTRVEPAAPPSTPQRSAKTEPTDAKTEPVNAPAVKTFTVRVLPMQNDSATAPARQAVDAFHASLLDGLRAIPGLVLITPESAGYAADAPTDYRLTLRGSGQAGDKFVVMLRAEATLPHMTVPIELTGDVSCPNPETRGCGDPAAMARLGLQLLSRNVFPTEPETPQESRARFLDTSLTADERMRALQDMSVDRMTTRAFHPQGGAVALAQDPQVVRGLAEFGSTTQDPVIRAEVWRAARRQHLTDLIPSLSDALRTDRDERPRVEAAATLASDFASDPQVRAVLEAAEREDARPMVRALARRGLQGEATWTDYVVSSLKDTNLSADDRIAPLFFTMNNSRDRTPDISRMLDDDASIEAFVDAFSKLQTSASGVQLPNAVLLSGLGSLNHPAITDLLLETLEHTVQPAVRQTIVTQLARHPDGPRAKAALMTLSTEDADPELREIAAKALKSSSVEAFR